MSAFKKILLNVLPVIMFIQAHGQTDFCNAKNTSFKAGEKLLFKVYYNASFVWINAGNASFSIEPEEMNGHEIPTEMLRNFPLPFPLLKGDSLKEHFLQCFKCAQSASVWKMRRPDGFEKLEGWVKECIGLNLIKASADH